MTGPSELGSMWRNTMGDCLTPSARAARTWSLVRWASIDPRSSRAKIGISTTAMATMTVHWLGRGASAAIETASSSDGIDSMTSTVRITNESIQPPNAPAMMPERHAADEAEAVAKTPTIRVWRAADQQAREHVAAAAVRAEREAGLGAGGAWSPCPGCEPGQWGLRGRGEMRRDARPDARGGGTAADHARR